MQIGWGQTGCVYKEFLSYQKGTSLQTWERSRHTVSLIKFEGIRDLVRKLISKSGSQASWGVFFLYGHGSKVKRGHDHAFGHGNKHSKYVIRLWIYQNNCIYIYTHYFYVYIHVKENLIPVPLRN